MRWMGLWLLLLLSACSAQVGDDRPLVLDCEATPQAVSLTEGWRFRLDEADAGLQARWYAADDLSAWVDIRGGMAWEMADARYADYDGVAWYALDLTVGEGASYLYIGDADDEATVWIDGQMAAELDASTPYVVLPLHERAEAGQVLRLVARLVDGGVYGGFKSPLRVASTRTAAIPETQRALVWAAENPDWPLPSWTRGAPLAWTMTGAVDGKDETLLSVDGAVAPYARAPIVRAMLYDPSTRQLSGLNEPRASFGMIRNTPVFQWEWRGEDGALVRQALFVDSMDGAVRWRIWADLRGVGARHLYLLTSPLGASREVRPIRQISARDAARLWVNGAPYLVAARPPQQVAVGALNEIMGVLVTTWPESRALDCEADGLGAALMGYTLDGGAEHVLDFALPSQPQAQDFPSVAVDAGQRLEQTADAWRTQLEQAVLRVPDERIQAALEASLGYLLLASDPDGPHPGPLAHDAVWVRDAAYMGLALLMAGHEERARSYLASIFDEQEESGRVPPIQGPNVPWLDDEWDSQGQAIFLAMAIYRYSQDEAVLREWYPSMRRAAEFIRVLRQTYAESGDARLRGLLPPSLSAEDLGPKDHHYYWDNLWAVTGLREAAAAARLLGEAADAAWMDAEADALEQAIRASVAAVMADEDTLYIPGSVEALNTSAMARGTVPALWPYRVFAVDDPLIVDSFRVYHERWIAPYGGGYLHREGQFWTYGGIELAHAYLRLNDGAALHQILGWTLEKQTLPGVYAWAEQVSPSNYGFTGGDMPHAWMAASFYALIREMLVSEASSEAGALELFRQVPGWWFEGDRGVELSGAPTHYGPVTLRTQGDLQSVDGRWQGQLTLEVSGAQPPAGFVWRVPGAVLIEGPPGVRINEDEVWIPGTGGRIVLAFGR